jgi:MFS family permease
MESLNNNETPFKVKVQIYGSHGFHLMAFSLLSSHFASPSTPGPAASDRASRKYHRKTLLYISGVGMTVFIFIAAILVRNMDGFASTQNFLNSPKVTTTGGGEGSYHEVLLLISILCYNSFSASGVMILPWTLISELYPIQVR